MVPRAAARAQRAPARGRDPLLRLPRHDAARRRPGRRLALRRRGRHGAAGRRRRRGAERGLRGEPRGQAHRPARPLRPPARRRARRRAGGASPSWPCCAAATRGSTSASREHLATDAVSIGPVRALRRRAGGDGGRRRGDPQAPRRPRATPTARSRSRSREALEGAPEYPHYTRPASYRGWQVPEVLLSGDHARVRRVAARAEPPAGRRPVWRLAALRYYSAAARAFADRRPVVRQRSGVVSGLTRAARAPAPPSRSP